MKTKITLAVGVAAGYVLGARAGRARYDQIADKARQAWDSAPAQDAKTKVSETVQSEAPKVKDAVSSAAATAADRARSVVHSDDDAAGTVDGSGAQPADPFATVPGGDPLGTTSESLNDPR